VNKFAIGKGIKSRLIEAGIGAALGGTIPLFGKYQNKRQRNKAIGAGILTGAGGALGASFMVRHGLIGHMLKEHVKKNKHVKQLLKVRDRIIKPRNFIIDPAHATRTVDEALVYNVFGRGSVETAKQVQKKLLGQAAKADRTKVKRMVKLNRKFLEKLYSGDPEAKAKAKQTARIMANNSRNRLRGIRKVDTKAYYDGFMRNIDYLNPPSVEELSKKHLRNYMSNVSTKDLVKTPKKLKKETAYKIKDGAIKRFRKMAKVKSNEELQQIKYIRTYDPIILKKNQEGLVKRKMMTDQIKGNPVLLAQLQGEVIVSAIDRKARQLKNINKSIYTKENLEKAKRIRENIFGITK